MNCRNKELKATDLSRAVSDLLLNELLNHRSVQEIVSAAYDAFGHPIIAFDTSFQCLAYAFDRPFSFAPWETIAETGRLPEDYIEETHTFKYQEKMYSNGHSSLFNFGSSESYPQVCGPIMMEGRLVGYVGTGVDGDADIEGLMQFNDILAGTLATALRTQVPEVRHSVSVSEKAGRILACSSLSKLQMEELEQLCKGPYVLSLLTSKDTKVSIFEYLLWQLCSEENAIAGAVLSDRKLLLLFYQVGTVNSLSEINRRIASLTEKYDITGGISDLFFHTDDIPAHRMQAELAVAAGSAKGNSHGNAYSFRKEYMNIICFAATERLGTNVSLPPAIRKLSQEDSTSHAEYLNTLRTYFENFENTNDTAAALGVHKNTILHRLHRIADIAGVDLTDNHTRLQLKLELSIFDFLHPDETQTERRGSHA